MDEELTEEDGKDRKDRMGFDVFLEPPRHDQVIYVTESNLLLARSPEYPQRIRVASVFELLDCSLSVWKQIFSFLFSSPPLL